MEERRLLLAVALSLLVLTAYSLLFPPTPQPPAPRAPVAPGREAEAGPAPAPTPGAATAKDAAPVATVADERERRVEVMGPDWSVAFSNRGARLVSWALARYKDARGTPEEMVPAAGAGVRPLDIETGVAEVDARLHEALFRASSQALQVTPGGVGSLRFEFAGEGLEVEKTLEFQANGLLSLRCRVTWQGRPLPVKVLWGPGIGNPTADERKLQGYLDPSGVALTAAGVERRPASKLAPPRRARTPVCSGSGSRATTSALFVAPTGGLGGGAASAERDGPGERHRSRVADRRGRPERRPAGAAVRGVKDYQALARLGRGLERVVPVGDWLGPIVVPLMGLLRWVHGHLGNWGWSIVALTVLINVVMAPLRHYSVVNGIKMAKLGPEMRRIQDRYRKVPLMDPRRQQMQDEVAALYARHGMNMGSQMMVGCLPLLLTMPFLFAFYRVLTVSVDLRGASFLWIADLAQKDPLHHPGADGRLHVRDVTVFRRAP